MAEEVMMDSVTELEYERFCTYSASEVLGTQIQN